MNEYDALKLDNQLCFPLYACSKGIIRKYKPYLDKIDLTYTQYITMLVLWENKAMNVKELGDKLFLDSGTLTPVLKKLEAKGYIKRERSADDERILIVSITESGEELKKEAIKIPQQMMGCVRLNSDEASFLYKILRKIMGEVN